ncbi:hypothetical protein IVG45_13200 [Methylomonas sp. LL1]|uniref:hypothetical protein n=1 Tax=Methylomonas sp. LL1 TaxID=2785785 RepID=UPI0018C3F590|nr:hypothetical protein [Methylomonas sp. LL1]QPK61821.1 hypothetical protein IVG45_13200 [Methylomonas sp. LL1]
MIKFSSAILDNFAPTLSKLSNITLPDLTNYDSQSCFWVQNYLLSTEFRARYPDPYHQIAMSYMRRVEASFREYELARTSLISYVSGEREKVSTYFSSIYHFEQLVSQSYQAYMLMRHLLHNETGTKYNELFKSSDGSGLSRLYKIYNYIKHCDEKLYLNKFPENASIPIWLTNTCICCQEAELKYEEIIEMLKDLANGANRFGDPEKLMETP